jgi:hypothetical protein
METSIAVADQRQINNYLKETNFYLSYMETTAVAYQKQINLYK